MDLVRRRDVAQATLARFVDRPLDYGRDDCVRMGAFVLRKLGRRPQLAKAGSYRSAKGAIRALKRSGYASIAEALDAHGLVRIPPAAALPADLVLLPGEGPFGGSLTVALGNGRVLGWHEDAAGADVLHPIDFVGAWRV